MLCQSVSLVLLNNWGFRGCCFFLWHLNDSISVSKLLWLLYLLYHIIIKKTHVITNRACE